MYCIWRHSNHLSATSRSSFHCLISCGWSESIAINLAGWQGKSRACQDIDTCKYGRIWDEKYMFHFESATRCRLLLLLKMCEITEGADQFSGTDGKTDFTWQNWPVIGPDFVRLAVKPPSITQLICADRVVFFFPVLLWLGKPHVLVDASWHNIKVSNCPFLQCGAP